MEINYNHPAFGVWHLAETPIKTIPYGALIKWFDQVIQFGFHLGGGEISWRDGVIRAEDLKTGPSVSWHDKKSVCVLARNGKAVVFRSDSMKRGRILFRRVSAIISRHGAISPSGSSTITANVSCIQLHRTRCMKKVSMKETFGNESALS